MWSPTTAVAAVSLAALSSVEAGNFLWISDYHNLPFYNESFVSSKGCKCFAASDEYRCTVGAEDDWFKPSTCVDDLINGTESDVNGNFYGQLGCDPPARLSYSAFEYAHSLFPDPAFLLSTGDNVAHYTCHFPETIDVNNESLSVEEQILLNIHDMTEALVSTWANSSVITLDAVAGNNDVCPDYYVQNISTPSSSVEENTFFVEMEDALVPSIHNQFGEVSGQEWMVTPTISALLINTLIYSPNLKTSNATDSYIDADVGPDPQGQFAWLDARLSALQNEKGGNHSVFIVGHIPPVFDQYSFKNEWKEEYAATYAEIVSRYPDMVKAQMFGHVHKNMVRAMPNSNNTAAMSSVMTIGAISPVYNNNPTFQDLKFDEITGEILNYTIYAANMSETSKDNGVSWGSVFSSTEYPEGTDGGLTSKGATKLGEAILSDWGVWSMYLFNSVSGAEDWDAQIMDWDYRLNVSCSVTDGWTTEGFNKCRNAKNNVTAN